MFNTRTALRVGCAVAVAGICQAAQAFEGGVSPYPAGATGTNIASMPPIPGLFVLQQFSYSYANAIYGSNGEKLPAPFRMSSYSATSRFLAAYPLNVFGANVYSQLVVPLVSLHTDVMGHRETRNGLANITISPVILRWMLSPELAVATGIDLSLANGSYNASRLSVPVGYFSVQPVFALRYNVPNGPDVGISNRVLLNQKNSDTDYRSGDAYLGEFAAGWNFGRWKLGVVGAYLNQYTDDKVSGNTVGYGNRAKSFGVGPSVVYDGTWWNINLNFQQGVYAANTAKTSSVWLNVALPLL